MAFPFVRKIAKFRANLWPVLAVLQESRMIGLSRRRRSIEAVATRALHRCACTFKYTAWDTRSIVAEVDVPALTSTFAQFIVLFFWGKRSYRLDRIELSPWTFLESWPARARQRHRQRSISGKIHHEMKQKETGGTGREVYGSLITIILTWN